MLPLFVSKFLIIVLVLVFIVIIVQATEDTVPIPAPVEAIKKPNNDTFFISVGVVVLIMALFLSSLIIYYAVKIKELQTVSRSYNYLHLASCQ